MKKFIFVLLLSSFCFGQNGQSIYNEITEKYHPDEYLYVIDGIPVNVDSLKQLYPKDIFSLTILTQEAANFSIVKSAVLIVTNKTETVYDLIVTEPGFDSFLAQQENEGTYSLEFLKSRNQHYVKRWNQKVGIGNPDIFDMRIDYSSNTEYDLELEYKLYQFFRFIEHKYKLRLI